MARIILTGDSTLAGRYLSWARSRLSQLKQRMINAGRRCDSQVFHPEGAEVQISSQFRQDIIRINAIGGEVLYIRCLVGSTTRDVSLDIQNLRYYRISGTKLEMITQEECEKALGMKIVDDCSYKLSSEPDSYIVDLSDGKGMLIPLILQSYDSKSKLDGDMRLYPGNSSEVEMFTAVTVGGSPFTGFLRYRDTLVANPFKVVGAGIDIVKYMDTGIAYSEGLSFVGAVLVKDYIYIGQFGDELQKVSTLNFKFFDPDRPAVVFNIPEYSGRVPVMLSAVFPTGKSEDLKMTRAGIGDWQYPGGAHRGDSAETYFGESYTPDGVTETLDTLPGTARAETLSSYWNTHRLTDHDGSTHNAFMIPLSVREDGKKSYILVEKSSTLTEMKSTLYIADKMVESTGMQPVVYPNPALVGGPIGSLQTKYSVMHEFQGKKYSAAVYRRTRYLSHHSEDALVGGQTLKIGYLDSKVKTACVDEVVDFVVTVNGKAVTLPINCALTEKFLYVDYTDSNPTGLLVTNSFLGWSTLVYFDTAGETQIGLRCLFSEAGEKLLMSFDVYPLNVSHELQRSGTTLYVTYKDSAPYKPFPPYTDAYWQPTGRQWWLFDKGGSHMVLETPMVLDGDEKPTDVMPNRLNGMSLLSRV